MAGKGMIRKKITMAPAGLAFGYMQKKLCLTSNFSMKKQEFP